MSQYADLKKVFINAKKEFNLPETWCVSLFVYVLDALEWNPFHVDMNDPDWEHKEFMLAKEELFGDKG